MQIYSSNGTGYDSVIEPSYLTQFENQSSGKPSTLIEKSITENGEYSASDDNADGYSKVNVNVPNTYTSEDEGKVVDNGALVTQTAMAEEITENGVVDTTLYDSVTVNVSDGGGGSSGNDVVFYDYDGSVVTSYSAADFANLSAMPANPTHEGLTAQGWNWSLADAKTYVASYGKLNIGQMYITSDGKTRLYFIVSSDSYTVELQLALNNNTELDVDWGDGSEHTSWTSDDGDSSKEHEYARAGKYVIAINIISGSFVFTNFDGTMSSIYRIEFGSNISTLFSEFFDGLQLTSLQTITIPNSVTSIGDTFQNCSALSSVVIPNLVTSIGRSTFSNCYQLSSVTIPNGVTSIGQNAFFQCRALSSITIPNSVTSIGDNAFFDCYALSSITIPNGVASIEGEAFQNCSALTSITIPDSVTSIGSSAFQNCSALTSITIPNSLAELNLGIFYNCYGLKSLIIPNSVKSISGMFYVDEAQGLMTVTFHSSTPPILSEEPSFGSNCIIRVPQGTLSAYTSAENYPDPSEYIYEEY